MARSKCPLHPIVSSRPGASPLTTLSPCLWPELEQELVCGYAASCTRATWSPLGVPLAEKGQTSSVGGSDGGKSLGVVGLTRKWLTWKGGLGTWLARERRPGSEGPGSLSGGQGPPGETSLGGWALRVRVRAEFLREPFVAGRGPWGGHGAGCCGGLRAEGSRS